VAEDRPVALIGTGSWGTALSVLLAGKGRRVALYARRPEMAEALSCDRENRQYLPGFALPDGVRITTDLEAAVAEAEFLVLSVPTVGMRQTARRLAPLLRDDQVVVITAKGLEVDTGHRMSEVIAEETGGRCAGRLVALSGPNLAREVAAGIASTSVAASPDEALAARVQELFMAPRFRVYTNPDLVGVELGGALKHIIAIGAGVSDGLGFGDNTKAALVTRGLAEITRLGVALGAQAATFRGLAGVGDLMATCASAASRNHRVGHELARGHSLDEVLARMNDMIAEGIPTTRAVRSLSRRVGVEMPIADVIHDLLFAGKSPQQAVAELMQRAGRGELE
jgi:glycerol-3-phosphate dehydrogenase (NAD(P)+)